jgi:hypothetical protein
MGHSTTPRALPWCVAEAEEGEEPEGAEAEAGEGWDFEEVDGVGGAALDGSLLHFIDALEDCFESAWVVSGEDFASGEVCDHGDRVWWSTAGDVDAVEDDVVLLEALGDLEVGAVVEVEAFAIGDEDDHAVAFVGGEEDFFGFAEGFADVGAAAEPRGEVGGAKEGWGVLEGGDIRGEGGPLAGVAAEEEEAEGVALAVGEKFIEGDHGGVVAGAFPILGHHAAGDIEAELNVGEFALVLGLLELSRAGEDDDDAAENEGGDAGEEIENEAHEAAVPMGLVIEGDGDSAGFYPPLEHQKQRRKDEQEEEPGVGEEHFLEREEHSMSNKECPMTKGRGYER